MVAAVTFTISHRRHVNGYPGEPTLHTITMPAWMGVPIIGAALDVGGIKGHVIRVLYSDSGVMLFVEEFT